MRYSNGEQKKEARIEDEIWYSDYQQLMSTIMGLYSYSPLPDNLDDFYQAVKSTMIGCSVSDERVLKWCILHFERSHHVSKDEQQLVNDSDLIVGITFVTKCIFKTEEFSLFITADTDQDTLEIEKLRNEDVVSYFGVGTDGEDARIVPSTNLQALPLAKLIYDHFNHLDIIRLTEYVKKDVIWPSRRISAKDPRDYIDLSS